MILWHFVNDNRPALVESPIDAQGWILTVDFRLIGFDEHKQRRSNSTVPLCLHPTSLIQLLQFWVPRTREFEEAILGSLRLPFLFQELDPEQEKTTLRILKGLGRFEGADTVSEEAITQVVLNEGLRDRLHTEHSEDEEITLVRDALVAEIKAQAEAQAAEVEKLRRQVVERETQLRSVDDAAKTSAEEVAALQAALASEKARAATAAEELHDQKARLEKLERSRSELAASRAKGWSLVTYIGLVVLIVALSFDAAYWAELLPVRYVRLLGVTGTQVLIGLLTFLLCHLLLELIVRKSQHRISSLWPFQQVRRFRRFL